MNELININNYHTHFIKLTGRQLSLMAIGFMKIFPGGSLLCENYWGGNFLCGNFPGANFPKWELSRWEFFWVEWECPRCDLSWVGMFFGGSFPCGTHQGGTFLGGTFYVNIFFLRIFCFSRIQLFICKKKYFYPIGKFGSVRKISFCIKKSFSKNLSFCKSN